MDIWGDRWFHNITGPFYIQIFLDDLLVLGDTNNIKLVINNVMSLFKVLGLLAHPSKS